MATYGIDFYGTTTYGRPVILEFDASPFRADSQAPGEVTLEWAPPDGAWSQQRLLRNSFGYPVTEVDGTTLLDQAAASASNRYIDRGLGDGGRFQYYSLFVYETSTGKWLRAGDATVLVLRDHGYGDRLYQLLPEHYRRADHQLAPGQDGPLKRFLQVAGHGFDHVHGEYDSLSASHDPDYVSGGLLPLLSAQLGLAYEPEVGMRQMRIWLRNAIHLYKLRGTRLGIEGVASAFTGWGADVTVPGSTTDIDITLQADRVNLVSNPSFDVNTTGWVGGSNTIGSPTRVTSPVRTGAGAARVRSASNSTTDHPSIRTPTFGSAMAVTEGETYTYSAYTRAATVPREAYIKLSYYETDGTSLPTATQVSGPVTVNTTTEWTRVSVTDTVPATAGRVSVALHTKTTTASEDHYWDDVLVERTPLVRSYFDGSMLGGDYLWEGTAHDSPSHYYLNRAIKNARLNDLLVDYVPLGVTWTLRYAQP